MDKNTRAPSRALKKQTRTKQQKSKSITTTTKRTIKTTIKKSKQQQQQLQESSSLQSKLSTFTNPILSTLSTTTRSISTTTSSTPLLSKLSTTTSSSSTSSSPSSSIKINKNKLQTTIKRSFQQGVGEIKHVIPNYTPPPPINAPKGSFEHHAVEAVRDGRQPGQAPKLTNIVRGSWTQRPILNYNIVEHLGREPEEVDSLNDGARIMVEPTQFTPQDYSIVPSIDEMSPVRRDIYLHHNELLRIKAAYAATPNTDVLTDKIDVWMQDFRTQIWQPVVQSYQTQQSRARMRLIDEHGLSYGKGGRKSSSARAVLKPGSGLMFVNGRPYTDYFSSTEHRSQVGMAFYNTGTVSQFDVFITVKGGGVTGQAEAAKLAVANALQNFEPQFRPTLKVNGLLKRDGRKVERKHVGHKKARKSFAWVKR